VRTSPCAPEAIEVDAGDGCPRTVRLGGRRVRVRERINTWRIDDEWWKAPVSRIYFLIELESGAVLTVFRDLSDGRWYRQNWRP
jgi:hypothetical protein